MNNAPPPPDYAGAAQQQAQASQANTAAQTLANRANTNTGFGSTSWTQNPGQLTWDPASQKYVQGPSSWTENTSLNGPLSGAQGEAEQSLEQNLGQPLDTGASARDQAVSAMYGAEAQQLNPQWALNDQLTQSQLANEGLSPTSEAARAQMNQEGLAKNQAYSQALSNAQQLGNQAQGITFGENVTSREMPLQELQGMLGLEAQPNYNQAGLAEAPQMLAAALGLGNYNLGATEENNKALGALGSGIGALGGAALGALPALVNGPSPILMAGAPFGL